MSMVYWSSQETAINILKTERNMPQQGCLPPVINPKGITHERAKYLLKETWEFCRPGTEELDLLPLKPIVTHIILDMDTILLLAVNIAL